MKRARILLMADKGATDQEIADALPAGTSTVFRTRRRFVEGGIDHARRSGGHRKYEYKRSGTANIFMFVDAHRPWRHTKVTNRRTNIDFAESMRGLVDVHCPDDSNIRVVLDNLNMAGIEIGVLSRQCLDRRIADQQTLDRETTAWHQQRNEAGARVNWMFRVDHARAKLSKVYPDVESERDKRKAA